MVLLFPQPWRKEVHLWRTRSNRRSRTTHMEVYFALINKKDELFRQYEHIVGDKGRRVRREKRDDTPREGGRGGRGGRRERPQQT